MQKTKLLSLTLDQVQEDIKSGKSKKAYYSVHSLWWTHLEQDLINATELGNEISKKRHAMFMADPNIPKEKKNQMESLFSQIKDSTIPTDPFGGPLMEIEVEKWVQGAIDKPEHFGENTLDAFMIVHHQNQSSFPVKNWKEANLLIAFLTGGNPSNPEPSQPNPSFPKGGLEQKRTLSTKFRGSKYTPPKKKRK